MGGDARGGHLSGAEAVERRMTSRDVDKGTIEGGGEDGGVGGGDGGHLSEAEVVERRKASRALGTGIEGVGGVDGDEDSAHPPCGTVVESSPAASGGRTYTLQMGVTKREAGGLAQGPA